MPSRWPRCRLSAVGSNPRYTESEVWQAVCSRSAPATSCAAWVRIWGWGSGLSLRWVLGTLGVGADLGTSELHGLEANSLVWLRWVELLVCCLLPVGKAQENLD